MTTPELNDDFRDLLACFRDDAVEFVVVGAHALAAHHLPRATGDLDVFVRPSIDNAARVYRALASFGAPLEAHAVDAAAFAEPNTVYQLGLPPRRIDILTSISGVTFDEAWAGHVEAVVAGEPVPFLGRAELIRNKRAAGRPKDLVDVAALERDPA